MYKLVFNHVLPFFSGIFVGLAVYYFLAPVGVPAPQTESTIFYGSGATSCWGRGKGSGYGSGSGIGSGRSETRSVSIISKPQATYTNDARANEVEGSVRLKVTLLASGEVGSIIPVTRLPHGLTEQAIAAARRIEFEPKKVNGVPVSSTVTIDYSFSIY